MIKYVLYFSLVGLLAFALATVLAFFLPTVDLFLLDANKVVVTFVYGLCKPYLHIIITSTITAMDSVHIGMIEMARGGSTFSKIDPDQAEAILRIFSFEFGLLVIELRFLLWFLMCKLTRHTP